MVFHTLEIRRGPEDDSGRMVSLRTLANVEVTFQSRSAAESGYIAVERGGKQSATIEVYEEDQARIEEDRIVIRGTLGEPDSTSAEFGDWILTTGWQPLSNPGPTSHRPLPHVFGSLPARFPPRYTT